MFGYYTDGLDLLYKGVGWITTPRIKPKVNIEPNMDPNNTWLQDLMCNNDEEVELRFIQPQQHPLVRIGERQWSY